MGARFARYKLYPEWQQRQSMTLEEVQVHAPGSTGIGCWGELWDWLLACL